MTRPEILRLEDTTMQIPRDDAHRNHDRMNRRQVLHASGAFAAAAGLAAFGLADGGTRPVAAAGRGPSLPPAAGDRQLQATSSAWDPAVPPSPWGPGDEAGSSNTQTADKVLQAVKLIKQGTKYP